MKGQVLDTEEYGHVEMLMGDHLSKWELLGNILGIEYIQV
jgi:hypothetical protein